MVTCYRSHRKQKQFPNIFDGPYLSVKTKKTADTAQVYRVHYKANKNRNEKGQDKEDRRDISKCIFKFRCINSTKALLVIIAIICIKIDNTVKD